MHTDVLAELGETQRVSLYGGAESLSEGAAGFIGKRPAKAYWRNGIFQLEPGEKARFAGILADRAPDLVIVEGAAFQQIFPVLADYGCRVVVDMHNVESGLARQLAASIPWHRPFRKRQMASVESALQEAELRAGEMADALWVCSEIDRARLLQFVPHRAVRVVPNATPEGVIAKSSPHRASWQPRLLFAGHLSYRPNVLAARELADEILPCLLRLNPEASIVIAGRSPSSKVRRLASHRVSISADPPDMAPLLAQADFAVVPLRQGGGTRIKILEAIEAGLIVVATAQAVEGLDLVPGEHYVLAERAQDMADAIHRLVQDPSEAERMAHEARAHAAERYSRDVVKRIVADEILRVVDCSCARPGYPIRRPAACETRPASSA
ncbi:glycosyltransferase family 4 protein [Terrihabitans sp. B22-R8]|uniref:glycosyltransferase family 4 protein n=1 Tax=Terrihabitans sp. B22-R8 TaxID=3425128 RepID=UPI00403C9B2D